MEFEHSKAFDEIIEAAETEFKYWINGPRSSPPQLDHFSDLICFRSNLGRITHSNQSYQEFFSNGKIVVGHRNSSFMHSATARLLDRTEKLLTHDGAQRAIVDHICDGPNSCAYQLRTCLLNLEKFCDEAFVSIEISRKLSFDGTDSVSGEPDWYYRIYSRLSDSEKDFCRLLTEGKTVKEISEFLEVSTRTIEKKRKTVLTAFGFEQPIEIVKMLVRLEERGVIPAQAGIGVS